VTVRCLGSVRERFCRFPLPGGFGSSSEATVYDSMPEKNRATRFSATSRR
jgi:hypothetical protein